MADRKGKLHVAIEATVPNPSAGLGCQLCHGVFPAGRKWQQGALCCLHLVMPSISEAKSRPETVLGCEASFGAAELLVADGIACTDGRTEAPVGQTSACEMLLASAPAEVAKSGAIAEATASEARAKASAAASSPEAVPVGAACPEPQALALLLLRERVLQGTSAAGHRVALDVLCVQSQLHKWSIS